MKKIAALTMLVLLSSTLSGDFCPVMAQRRGGGAVRGQAPSRPAQPTYSI
jgi:hypothetical protein